MKYMKPQSLRCFLAAAREENITKAASDELTLSRPLLELEHELGKRFFRAAKKGLILTEARRLLQPRAKKSFPSWAERKKK